MAEYRLLPVTGNPHVMNVIDFGMNHAVFVDEVRLWDPAKDLHAQTDPGELPDQPDDAPDDVPTSNPDGPDIAQPDPEDDPWTEHVSPTRED